MQNKTVWGKRRHTWLWLGLIACALAVAFVHAADERYDYDELGRLIRAVDELGRETRYVYDAAGNLLQVITGANAEALSVTGLTPGTLRRGAPTAMLAVGTGLTGARVTSPDPALQIANVQASATQVTFILLAASAAALGTYEIGFSNAGGSARKPVSIIPEKPEVFVTPAPLALPPDGSERPFLVRLSHADIYDHNFALSITDTGIAALTTASVTIPAGQTEANARIKGLNGGQTVLRLASDLLGTTAVPVFVTAEFAGVNTSYALPVGVVVGQSQTSPPPNAIGPVAAANVGVVVGGVIRAVTPNVLPLGSGPTNVVISGASLGGTTDIQVQPGDGVVLGNFVASGDGKSVTVPIAVAADAPTTIRRLVVSASGTTYPAAPASADRIRIALPLPEILSTEPIYVLRGATSQTILVRGRNLQGATAVSVSPDTGVSVEAPAVNADGTQLTFRITVAPNAPLGARAVSVTTPGGNSDATPGAANTLTIADQAGDAVTPIAAPNVGVLKQDNTPPPASPSTAYSKPLGVLVGGAVTGITPVAKPIGESFTLTVQGVSLDTATAVDFLPNTGITVGTPTVAANGRSLTVPVSIALDAPQTLRTVQVLAGANILPAVPAAATQFRVTAMPPVIDWVSPLYLVTGAPPTTLIVHGRNFQNATQVAVLPPNDVAINNPPVVSTDGTQLTVNLSATAGAANGPRVVQVITPAGGSVDTFTDANTLMIAGSVGATVTPVAAPLVGILKQDGTTPPAPTTPVDTLTAPLVGIMVGQVTPPPPGPLLVTSPLVGVAIHPVAQRIEPVSIVRGTSATLTVFGAGLDAVTDIRLNPATGITMIPPVVASADGTQVSIAINVDPAAAATAHEVIVDTAAGKVPFSPANKNQLLVAIAEPRIDSIDPILAVRGTTFTLTVRGANLFGATGVTATPGTGIAFDATPTVSTDGTSITLRMSIAADAPLGSQVIRVTTPGGTTTPDAAPANTFTVYSNL